MTEIRKDLKEFEMSLRARSSDPAIRLFLDLIEGTSAEIRSEMLERQKRIMSIPDALSKGMQNILSQDNGEQHFLDELRKRVGSRS